MIDGSGKIPLCLEVRTPDRIIHGYGEIGVLQI